MGFNIDSPKLPRTQKISKRFDQDQSETHVFQSVHEWYWNKYFTIYDQVTASLKSRFDTEYNKFFEFYDKHFDKERLLSDRGMLFNFETSENLFAINNAVKTRKPYRNFAHSWSEVWKSRPRFIIKPIHWEKLKKGCIFCYTQKIKLGITRVIFECIKSINFMYTKLHYFYFLSPLPLPLAPPPLPPFSSAILLHTSLTSSAGPANDGIFRINKKSCQWIRKKKFSLRSLNI